jgi:hypothetical protein
MNFVLQNNILLMTGMLKKILNGTKNHSKQRQVHRSYNKSQVDRSHNTHNKCDGTTYNIKTLTAPTTTTHLLHVHMVTR